MEIPLVVARKEPLRLVIQATKSYDFGKFQVSLNGVKLGEPIDLYSAETDSGEFHFLDFWPEPGRYTVRIECVGRNALSKGWYLGVESVRLRERRPRVLQFGHDRDNDWRKDPRLYN